MEDLKYKRIVKGYIYIQQIVDYYFPLSLISIIVKYLLQDLPAAQIPWISFDGNNEYLSKFEWFNYISLNKYYYPCYEYTLDITNKPKSILCQSTAPYPPPLKFQISKQSYLHGLWIGFITNMASLSSYKHDNNCLCPCQWFSDDEGYDGMISFGILCQDTAFYCGWIMHNHSYQFPYNHHLGAINKLDKICIDPSCIKNQYKISIEIQNKRLKFTIIPTAIQLSKEIQLVIPRSKYRMYITIPSKYCKVTLNKFIQKE